MISVVLALVLVPAVKSSTVSPIDKVLQLLSDLETKINGEGKEAQKTYEEFAEWCEERSKDLQFEIKTGKGEAAALEATIAKETANIGALDAKLDELTAELATDEADLKAATWIRAKEQADFTAEENELTEIVD